MICRLYRSRNVNFLVTRKSCEMLESPSWKFGGAASGAIVPPLAFFVPAYCVLNASTAFVTSLVLHPALRHPYDSPGSGSVLPACTVPGRNRLLTFAVPGVRLMNEELKLSWNP